MILWRSNKIQTKDKECDPTKQKKKEKEKRKQTESKRKETLGRGWVERGKKSNMKMNDAQLENESQNTQRIRIEHCHSIIPNNIFLIFAFNIVPHFPSLFPFLLF